MLLIVLSLTDLDFGAGCVVSASCWRIKTSPVFMSKTSLKASVAYLLVGIAASWLVRWEVGAYITIDVLRYYQ